MAPVIEMRTYKLRPGKRRNSELEQRLMPLIDKYEVVLVEDTVGLFGEWKDAAATSPFTTAAP